PGETSAVFSIPQGAVVVRLKAKSDFDQATFEAQYDDIFQTLTSNRQNEVWNEYIQSLRENAEIVDNRLRLL
ncbi:MAG: hypothetical protein K9M49_08025, partial [Candidatus Marinimicrobia bacterium]|nr:hypothetical protein [Candidatus Neomarinimicrobiota bacterium]